MSDIRVLCVENHPEYIWTNSDDIRYTAMSTGGVFKSNVMDSDEKFSYTFARSGTYIPNTARFTRRLSAKSWRSETRHFSDARMIESGATVTTIV